MWQGSLNNMLYVLIYDCMINRGAGADNEEVGHGGQLPQNRGSGVWHARRHRRRRHDPSWIQQRGSQALVQVCGQHCAGRWGAGQGGCAQQGIPQGKSVLLQEGGTGLQVSSDSANPWCCRGSCTVQRSLGPSQRRRGHNWRPSTMAA